MQAGGYGEHQLLSASAGGQKVSVNAPVLSVRLEPGAGSTIEFQMKRYANAPTWAHPWDRSWYGSN